MNRVAAQRGEPSRVGELGGDQPPDLGAEHVGQREGQPGEAPVQLAQQLVLRRGAQRHPAGPVGRPGRQLGQHRVAVADRQSPAGQQQLGHRLQVDGVGLDRALAQHPALLGDVAGIELQQLPARRPRPAAQQRLVVVPGSLDPDLDLRVGRQQPLDRVDHARAREGAVIGQPSRGFSSFARAASVTENGELVLADIDRDHDRRGRDWGSMNNHGTHLRGCRKTTARQRRTFKLRNLTVPSKHLRRCP